MRNLKRALSLGLTAAMISGLMVMGSSAASYADVTSEDNVEAIEVLEAVGIMIGDENGNFNPDQNVTRNEMAVVMSNLMEYNVASYKDTSPFTDVPSWAEPYVAACWTNGITAGYSDTIYGGSDTVTTAQAALMLMKALGYFQYASDFGGDWQLATTRQGNAIDLFVGVDSGVEQAMTRNDVAQLVLNTLKSGTVEASTDGSWTIGNVTINNNVKYNYITSNADYAQAINTVTSTDANTDAGQSIIELGEQLYMGDLELKNNDTDVFGRPARTWEYDSQKIGTYMKTELLKQEYTAKVTGRDMYDLLGSNVIDNYTFTISVDGETERSVLDSAYFTEKNFVRSNDDAVGETGNGVLTQVFVDNINKRVNIAVINTYLAKAAEDYDEKNDELDLDVFNITEVGTTECYVKDDASDETMTVEGADFDIEDVVEDDLFLVTVADGEIQSMADPEILADSTITKFKTTKYVISDGTQYDYADTARYDEDVLDVYTSEDGATINLKDLTYNIILDQYGYLIGIEQNEDPDQYLFLTGIDLSNSNLSNRNADANVIFLDGTMDTITVNMRKSLSDSDGDGKVDDALSALTDNDNGGRSQLNTWCTYTVNSDGVYTLKQVSIADDTAKTMQKATGIGAGGEIDIDEKHVTLDGFGSYAKVYGNDDSVYINVELEKIIDDNESGGQPVWIIDDVESITTGISNVSLTVKELGASKDGYDYPGAEIYTLFDEDGYVIAAVTIGENQGTTTNYAYITSARPNSEEYNSSTDEWTFTREAIVNGEFVELVEVSDAVDVLSSTSMEKGNWYKIKYDADGHVRGREIIEPSLTDGTDNDGYINQVSQVEKASEAKDLVLLDADLAYTTGNVYLSYKGGTLYVTTSTKEGFYVSPDVQVALALASKPDSTNDNLANAFDSVDTYTGRDGLVKALRNLDTEGKDIDGDGIVEYLFNGNLAAVIEDGVATSIVLDDRSGTLSPDYNPLKAMTVTFELRERGTNYLMTSVEKKYYAAPTVLSSDNAEFISAIKAAGWGDYAAKPITSWGSGVSYVEGSAVTVVFYYEEVEASETATTIEVTASGATVTLGGVVKGNGGVYDNNFSKGDVVEFTVANDGSVTDANTAVVTFNGDPVTAKSGKYTVTLKEGLNALNVTISPKTYTVNFSTNEGWAAVPTTETGVKNEVVEVTLTYKEPTVFDWDSWKVTVGGSPLTIKEFTDGEATIPEAYTAVSPCADADDFAAAQAEHGTLYVEVGSTGKYVEIDEFVDGSTTYYYYTPQKLGTIPSVVVEYKITNNASVNLLIENK